MVWTEGWNPILRRVQRASARRGKSEIRGPKQGRNPKSEDADRGNIQHPTSNAQHPIMAQTRVLGCWVLDVGCWMLGVGCWVLDVGCWMLDVGCWMLDVGCWMLDVGCWMLDVGCWMFFGFGFRPSFGFQPCGLDASGIVKEPRFQFPKPVRGLSSAHGSIAICCFDRA